MVFKKKKVADPVIEEKAKEEVITAEPEKVKEIKEKPKSGEKILAEDLTTNLKAGDVLPEEMYLDLKKRGIVIDSLLE